MSATRFALCGVVFLLQLAPVTSLAAEVGSFVPEFSLPSLHDPGENVVLSTIRSSNRGKLIYVDFWSAWCKPCRDKMPQLDELRADYDSLEVIGVNVDPLVTDAIRFLSEYPVEYPIALDMTGETARSFGVETLPVGFLIDQQGVVRSITKSADNNEIQKLTFLIESLSFPMGPAESAR